MRISDWNSDVCSSDLRLTLDRAGQRIATRRAEADRARQRLFAGGEPEAIVIDHQDQPVAFHRRARRREIERHDLDLLELDILPDVEFGPVRQRKDADALALRLARIIQPPQFWALVLGIPAVAGRTEREDALLVPAFLLITARAAEQIGRAHV